MSRNQRISLAWLAISVFMVTVCVDYPIMICFVFWGMGYLTAVSFPILHQWWLKDGKKADDNHD